MRKSTFPSGTLLEHRYLIKKLLGQGSLGRTYLAYDQQHNDAAVVLKEFSPVVSDHLISDHLNESPSKALFQREATLLCSVKHPQLPDGLACFESDGRLFFVQQYIDGVTYSALLRDRYKKGKTFTEEEMCAWLKSLLPVLDYIHGQGLLHRDISPDNILLSPDNGLPMLVDFGVGKQKVSAPASVDGVQEDVQMPEYVEPMNLGGKAGYAPNEQMRFGVCSPSSDLYSLGLTAVILLTGQTPSTLLNQYFWRWDWRSHAEVSLAFGLILDKLIADTRASRYSTAVEVLNDVMHLGLTNLAMSTPDSRRQKKWSVVEAKDTAQSTAVVEADAVSKTALSDVSTTQTQTTVVVDADLIPITAVSNARTKQPTAVSNVAATNAAAVSDAVAPSKPSALLELQPRELQPKSGEVPSSSEISPDFIASCQLKLVEYIGPMASVLVGEVMENQSPKTPEQLVPLLITDAGLNAEEAISFRKDLFGKDLLG
ncbi:MAG: serine/threonine-protein kinase [Cyanobacteria bacterium P01_F01_bin.53]